MYPFQLKPGCTNRRLVGPEPRDYRLNMKILLALAAFMLMVLTGCGSEPDPTSSPVSESTSAPTVPATPAGPEMSSVSSCDNDYPLVLDPATMSVIATAQVTNDGDEPGKALVSVQWFPVGGDPIKANKTVQVEAGDTVRVPFKVKPSQSAMNGMVGLQHGDEMCRVDVKLVP